MIYTFFGHFARRSSLQIIGTEYLKYNQSKALYIIYKLTGISIAYRLFRCTATIAMSSN
jgi:hypothetical protein